MRAPFHIRRLGVNLWICAIKIKEKKIQQVLISNVCVVVDCAEFYVLLSLRTEENILNTGRPLGISFI